MTGKWRWLIYLLIAWQVVRASISAFVNPWRWSADQCLFILFVGVGCLWAGTWLFIWIKDGSAGVRRYRTLRQEKWNKAMNPKIFQWSLLFWVVVAIALVVVFNISQH
jgi:hypothetical protein